MIFHESIDATFLFLAGTSDDRIRTLLLDERNGRSIPTMSSSFEMASLALPEISGFVAESMRFSSR